MKLSFLGTIGAAVTADRDNTCYVIECGKDLFMVDCSGNPAGKLLKLGYDPSNLVQILFTHLHIDHCYGLPTLLFHMFLTGRVEPIVLAAPDSEYNLLISQLESHQIYPEVRSFALIEQQIPVDQEYVVFKNDTCCIKSAEADHCRAARAFRFEEISTGKSVVISGDTRPCSNIINLARGTDVLIHESSFPHREAAKAAEFGHSTALQAGEVAQLAQARSLYLIHFDANYDNELSHFVTSASQAFSGQILIPDELTTITI